jgi:tetratricopeptide (TPR) repeat protein
VRRRVLAIAVLLACGRWPVGAAGASREGACAGLDQALQSAAQSLEMERWAEAEERLKPLAASRPECGEVVLGLARARAGQSDPAEAERFFERAAALAPADARAHALFAQYWLSRGQVARADYLSARALSLDPDCPEALVAQGRILDARGRVPEAVQALEKAVRLAPASAEAHYQLGTLFSRRLRYVEAARELEQVVTLRPRDARAHDHLAVAFEVLGDAEKADLAYRSGLKANEGTSFDDLLDYNYGRFLLKERRLEESQAHLDRALALRPQDRAVRYERAKLSVARVNYPAAREDAERALALRGQGPVLDVQVYYLLATVYRRLGEDELAGKYAELARTTPIPGQD